MILMLKMLKKIFKPVSCAALSLALIFSILLTGSTSANALVKGWSPIEDESSSIGDNGDNPLEIVIVPIDENQNLDDQESINGNNIGNYPDLGSDQVFPFVAGLDSFK